MSFPKGEIQTVPVSTGLGEKSWMVGWDKVGEKEKSKECTLRGGNLRKSRGEKREEKHKATEKRRNLDART